MKKYIMPQMTIVQVNTAQMIANSPALTGTYQQNGTILSKERDDENESDGWKDGLW